MIGQRIRRAIKNPWICFILVLVAIELICRVSILFFYSPPNKLYTWADDRGWTLRPGYEGENYHTTVHINTLGLRDRERVIAKPINSKRIICLGDSRTFGFAVHGHETYPSMLERILKSSGDTSQNTDLEIWNAGIPGHTAFQGRCYLESELLQANPDIVVISYGFNDRRYVAKPEWIDSQEYFVKFASGMRLRERMSHLGIGQIIANAAQSIQRYRITRNPPSPLELTPRLEQKNYISELKKTIEICQKHSIVPVLLLLSDAPLTRADVEHALDLIESGKIEEAVPILEEGDLSGLFGKSLLCHIELIKLGQKTGVNYLTQEQIMLYNFSASTHGASPVRHDRDYRHAAADLAKDLGITCVDMTNRLDAMPQVFLDQCHFSPVGHAAVAEALAEVIPSLLAPAIQNPSTESQ